VTASPRGSTPPARVLAGVFDPAGGPSADGEAAVRAALAGEAAVTSAAIGPLTLAWSGGPAPGRGLCVLDGELRARDPKRSPEELLAHAHGALGADMLDGLEGEFAFVVWDPERRRGMLARDPLGVRPLFVHDDGRRLLFGSDVRQVLRLLDRRPAPDRLALARWLAGAERSDEETLYEGVRPLPPASWIALERGRRAPRRYWTPRWRQPRGDGRDAVAAVSAGLERAVSRHTGTSGDVGVMLSGGLDSAAVAALAAAAAGERVRSYSAVFPRHPTVDESKPIGLLRRRLGLPGTQLAVEPGSALAGGLRFLSDWAVPPAPPSHFLWQPLVGRAGADGVTRMLDGEGGDELLGVAAYLMADRLRHGRPLAALRLAGRVPGSPGSTASWERCRTASRGACAPRSHRRGWATRAPASCASTPTRPRGSASTVRAGGRIWRTA
jgi:asparagine synthase (glutamine-hydrolysing)